MILLIKLFLAHLLGDFLFQPETWVKAKEEKKIGAWQLYCHVLIHFTLIMIFVFDLSFWYWAVILTFTHLLVDSLKQYLINDKSRRSIFFIDQLVHFSIILFLWMIYEASDLPIQNIQFSKVLLIATALFSLTTPASLSIRFFISKWTPKAINDDTGSLQAAGTTIGIIERLFVFVFLILGHWEAIGFLLAAKSIFRFGDLKESKERMLTEYVLIGTLLSFGSAVVVGILYLKLALFI